jgi:serine/threonine-protein kinase
VDDYRLIAEIGAGGMAEVYLAVREGPGGFAKLTCLKVLRSEYACDPEMLAMFMAEARLAARINHPHVVQTFEVGESDGFHFIAMEYLEGQPYARLRPPTRMDAFPLDLRVKIIAEALEGLHAAHEMRGLDGVPLELVHRDMSPNNIFVTYDGVVKILDFGIAKAGAASQVTRSGVLRGTVGYMAPEQARGEALDRRADLYAVGVILWETLVGRRVWQGMNDIAIFNKLLHEKIPAPRSESPDVPEELDRICRRLLAPRDERYATALELQADLEKYLDSVGAKITERDIGKAVAETFTNVRESTRAIIEEQLNAPPASSTLATTSMPSLPVPSAGTIGPLSKGRDSIRTLTAEVRPHGGSASPRRSFFTTWRFPIAAAVLAGAATFGVSSLRRHAVDERHDAPAASAPIAAPIVAPPEPTASAAPASASPAPSAPSASVASIASQAAAVHGPLDPSRTRARALASGATTAEPPPPPPPTPSTTAPTDTESKKRRLDTVNPFK